MVSRLAVVADFVNTSVVTSCRHVWRDGLLATSRFHRKGALLPRREGDVKAVFEGDRHVIVVLEHRFEGNLCCQIAIVIKFQDIGAYLVA
ncbi:hypothetical protein MNBD_ALPHA09-956 [hydrothermal vent metagenome]|uniref:Uncharacterized protein n=1 Tax=hydrothermal vent metagenome TaxID=652676 RepID=A0A3B0TQH3_9ZZZZ